MGVLPQESAFLGGLEERACMGLVIIGKSGTVTQGNNTDCLSLRLSVSAKGRIAISIYWMTSNIR